MPYSDPAKRRAAQRRHYEKNKASYFESRDRNYLRLKEIMVEAKDKPCADCGVRYPPWVMQCDHRPGEVKVGNVSSLIRQGNEARLRDEIEKCDIVCSNCHAERTHSRRG